MTLLHLAPAPAVSDRVSDLPIVVIGAGPVGLAAAAHLAERGIDFVVLESGDGVAGAVRRWGHVRMFSPWQHLVDPVATRLLAATGWDLPASDVPPTGAELVTEYLEPLSRLGSIAPRIRLGATVTAVARDGMDRTRTSGRFAQPFVLRVRDGSDGVSEMRARAVIDASGTFGSPNPLSSDGLELLGLAEVAEAVVGPLPDVLGRDRSRFAGKRVTVVGAGHSAANTLLALAELTTREPKTTVTWLIRHERAVRVSSSPDDELPGRARLGVGVERAVADGRVRLERLEILRARTCARGGVELVGRRGDALAVHETDVIVTATGFRPDLAMLREIRLDLDEIVEAPRRLAPLIDPNLHSCGTVEPHGFRELSHPERDFFLVGMKSYGRAPTFLLATGYEQTRSVVASLAGDAAAAARVELTLPATGVCSTDPTSASGCCS